MITSSREDTHLYTIDGGVDCSAAHLAQSSRGSPSIERRDKHPTLRPSHLDKVVAQLGFPGSSAKVCRLVHKMCQSPWTDRRMDGSFSHVPLLLQPASCGGERKALRVCTVVPTRSLTTKREKKTPQLGRLQGSTRGPRSLAARSPFRRRPSIFLPCALYLSRRPEKVLVCGSQSLSSDETLRRHVGGNLDLASSWLEFP